MKTKQNLVWHICIAIVIIDAQNIHAQQQPVIPAKTFQTVIQKMDSNIETGTLEEIKDSSIVISYSNNNDFLKTEIPYSDIRFIKWRRADKPGKGALLGLVFGMTSGVLIANINKNEDDFANIKNSAAVATGLFLGAAAGAAIGAIVGTASRSLYIEGKYDRFQKLKENFEQSE